MLNSRGRCATACTREEAEEECANEGGHLARVETKEDKGDGMVAMDKTKEVVVVMEEEIVIMAHHLEEEAAEVPCEEVCLFFFYFT